MTLDVLWPASRRRPRASRSDAQLDRATVTRNRLTRYDGGGPPTRPGPAGPPATRRHCRARAATAAGIARGRADSDEAAATATVRRRLSESES
jgi:hypothetical protein